MQNEYVRVRNGSVLVNSYAIYYEKNAIIIDPGKCEGKEDKLLNGHIPVAIYLTHGHIDHFHDAEYFRKKYDAKIYIHENDVKYLTDESLSCPLKNPPRGYERKKLIHDHTFKDGDKIIFGEDEYLIIHTPGHTEGSSCFYCDGVIFTGDTLFNGAVGRTDFPLGSQKELEKSLERLFELPIKTVVEAGHGYSSIIGAEKYFPDIDM